MGTYQLTFAMETQKQTNWCWAAVAVSVANFFGRPDRYGKPGVNPMQLTRYFAVL